MKKKTPSRRFLTTPRRRLLQPRSSCRQWPVLAAARPMDWAARRFNADASPQAFLTQPQAW